MAYLLRFDGDITYDFPDSFYPVDASQDNNVPNSRLVRAAGARQLVGNVGQRKLVVRGGFYSDLVTMVNTEVDTLLAALHSGPGSLYFGESTRYYRCCQWEHFGEQYEPPLYNQLLLQSEITFVTGDPYRYSTTVNEEVWSAPATATTHDVTAGGNAPAVPLIKIATESGSGLQVIGFTITNTTTGESFTLSGAVNPSDTIEVDSKLKTVKVGTTDRSILFDGQFPTLGVGVNTFSNTQTLGGITSITFDWENRYY